MNSIDKKWTRSKQNNTQSFNIDLDRYQSTSIGSDWPRSGISETHSLRIDLNRQTLTSIGSVWPRSGYFHLNRSYWVSINWMARSKWWNDQNALLDNFYQLSSQISSKYAILNPFNFPKHFRFCCMFKQWSGVTYQHSFNLSGFHSLKISGLDYQHRLIKNKLILKFSSSFSTIYK